MPGRSGTIGEIQRPLIFKLRSRFQLKEIVAQKMHISDTVYAMLDVDRILGVGRVVAKTGLAGTAAAGTYVTDVALTVPTGKRWRVGEVSIYQSSAVALADAMGAVQLLRGGSVNMPVTPTTTAGAIGTFIAAVSSLGEAMILEEGDSIGLIVSVSAAATTYVVSAFILEEDFRENVV